MTASEEALAVRIKAVLCLHCGATVVSDPAQTTVDDMDKLRRAFIDHDARCTSNPTVAALAAERALADRLAEALEQSHKLTVALFKGKPTGFAVDEMGRKIGEALAAWRVARGKA